jgi:apolipoprotein D and lipocalin family protein
MSDEDSPIAMRMNPRTAALRKRTHVPRLDSPTMQIHLVAGCAALFLAGCHGAPMKPIEPVSMVELPRFMGDWYVIAHIPTFLEKSAFNAIESYALNPNGTIATTFTFNKGASDGPLIRYEPKGFVRDSSNNSVWGMQFVWPVKAQYIIAHLDSAYSQTIVARDKRDYVWIMARTPILTPEAKDALFERVHALGYDMTKLRLVPQR